MKENIRNTIRGVVCLLLFATISFAQDRPKDQVSLAFSDATKPGLLRVGLIRGGIRVQGYAGKEVVIESSLREENHVEKSVPSKAKGMQRIENRSTGMVVEEDGNVMTIDVGSIHRSVDLEIRVPVKTSLDLSCVNDGDIIVEDVEGEIEVNNINGKVRLLAVSGSVIAHALNHKVVVDFKRVDPSKSMSFSSLNGDIDVTFPASLKADVKIKADNGEIFSDFDIEITSETKRVEEEHEKRRSRRVVIENAMYGKINGGGPEIQFTSFNGDVLIRKRK